MAENPSPIVKCIPKETRLQMPMHLAYSEALVTPSDSILKIRCQVLDLRLQQKRKHHSAELGVRILARLLAQEMGCESPPTFLALTRELLVSASSRTLLVFTKATSAICVDCASDVNWHRIPRRAHAKAIAPRSLF